MTQVRVLDHARTQVCDLVETMTDQRPDEDSVEVIIDLGALSEQAHRARQMTASAADAQKVAAAASRKVVADLRAEGLSVSDIATILGVSRGRVSHLLADASEPAPKVANGRRPRRAAAVRA